MSGCKHPIWKILSAGTALLLMLPSLALGEFGVCPPYSKTFGPDDPIEEVQAFVAEANLRPGGGTLVLKPANWNYNLGYLSITGTLCVRTTSAGVEPGDAWAEASAYISVASGGTLTVQSIKFTGYVIGPTIINVEHGGLFFGDNVFNPYVRNEGSIFLKDSELISWANRGFSSIEGSIFIPDETDREKEEFTNSGYASLSRVNGGGISNSGILVVARSTLNTAEYCYDAGIQEFVCEIVAAIDNVGVAEVANSMVETCEGPVTDLGHNEFYAGGGCIVTDPTSTYYNGEVVEAAVRARPYHWREVGTIDLSTTDLMTIYVYSTETFDATRILFETVAIEGFDPDAKGWPWTLDVGRDGLMDYQVTWWLNRMPPLPCGYQEHEFSAMTEDGREVRGLLKFNAVGCTP